MLVVSDDAELGGLIALNLRLRGFIVEHTDLALTQSHRWAPSFGRPDLLILDLEAADRVPPVQVARLAGRPWAVGVPILLAAEKPSALAGLLRLTSNSVVPRPSDVGGIVARARTLLGVEA